MYKKMAPTPKMNRRHFEARVQWAKDHFDWNRRWKRVVFSGEKKFILDGPDLFSYYWHDLRKEERYFSTHQKGGGGFMLWAAMSYYGLSRLVVIHATINSRRYRRILDAGLRPFVAEFAPQDWIFQQDNAPAHVAHDNHDYFF